MRVFNLAEELEKERKKNKELEERIKEFKLTIRTQFQQIQELIDRENRAIEYINIHSEMTDIQIYGIENTLYFRGNVDKLLDILKGDNK